jgi:hypothetical protein
MPEEWQAETRLVLRGDSTEITYESGAISERLTYDSPDHQRDFSDGDLRIEHVSIGRLVTATLESVPGVGELTVTLLVPTIYEPRRSLDVPDEPAEAEVTTVAILARHPTSVGGPHGLAGPLESYSSVTLTGAAQRGTERRAPTTNV